MNRNTKRYPQEEITSLKKRGKRLRGGYLLAKLKNWKSSGTKPEIDRPKTIKPKPLTTKRKTEPKQKVEAKGRAIPKSIEVKPLKAKKTIAKQPKQKVEGKGRAIPKSIEIKPVKAKKTIAKQPKQKVEGKGSKIDMVMLKLAYDKWEELTEDTYSLTYSKKWGIWKNELSKIFLNEDIILFNKMFLDNSWDGLKKFHEMMTSVNSIVSIKNNEKYGTLSEKQDTFRNDLNNGLMQLSRTNPKRKVKPEEVAILKSFETKPVETKKKVRKPRQQSVNKIVVEKIKQAEQKPNSSVLVFNTNYEEKFDDKIVPKLLLDLSRIKKAFDTWNKFDKKNVFILANRQNSQDWKKWEKYVHRLFKNTKDNYLEVLYYDINYFVNHLKKIVKSNSDDIKSFRTDLLIALSNNNELNIKEALFDNFNPNTEQELQAIAKDIPAFGDDVNEEKFDVDGKYNLPEVVQKRDNMEVASVKDIKTMRFKALTLPSKYRQLLGKVPANFRMLLWGSPGHGKSSLALTIANDIGKFVKTLYVSAEESLQSATLSSRIKRFKANARNLMFNDSNNPDILDKIIMTQNPKFVVIDSVNVMIGKTEAIINLMLKYPEVGFIIIAQATKDRKKYAGLGSLAHAVDIVVNVRSGMAVAEKNRYAQLGSMPVKGIKI